MQVTQRTRGDVTVLELRGIVNMLDAPSLNDLLNELVANKRFQIVLNLRQVTLIDSTGFGVLLAAEKKLRNFRTHLHLAETPDPVLHILKSNGLGGYLERFATEDEACQAFG